MKASKKVVSRLARKAEKIGHEPVGRMHESYVALGDIASFTGETKASELQQTGAVELLFEQGSKGEGEVVARVGGKVVLPMHGYTPMIRPGETWTGELVEKERYYLFKPGLRSDGTKAVPIQERATELRAPLSPAVKPIKEVEEGPLDLSRGQVFLAENGLAWRVEVVGGTETEVGGTEPPPTISPGFNSGISPLGWAMAKILLGLALFAIGSSA